MLIHVPWQQLERYWLLAIIGAAFKPAIIGAITLHVCEILFVMNMLSECCGGSPKTSLPLLWRPKVIRRICLDNYKSGKSIRVGILRTRTITDSERVGLQTQSPPGEMIIVWLVTFKKASALWSISTMNRCVIR